MDAAVVGVVVGGVSCTDDTSSHDVGAVPVVDGRVVPTL
jgi:hypothetical protein